MFWNKTKMINDDAKEIDGGLPPVTDWLPVGSQSVKSAKAARVPDNENCHYKVGADSAGNVHLFVGVEYSVTLKMNAGATKQLIKLLTAALPDID